MMRNKHDEKSLTGARQLSLTWQVEHEITLFHLLITP